MSRSRLGLLAIGLSVLPLALLSLHASPARAEAGAFWEIINGKGEPVVIKSGGLSPLLRLKEVESGEKVLTTILSTKIEKRCTGYELVNAKLAGEGTVSVEAKVRFTGCIFVVNGKIVTACEPHTGKEKGVLESLSAKAFIELNEGKPIIKIEPASGEVFMVVELGAECSFGEKVPLIGSITLKDSQGELSVAKVTHLMEEGPKTNLWVISKTEEHRVRFDGTAIGELAGEHLGLKFRGVAG